MFNRIMGGMWYGEEGIVDSFLWSQMAGVDFVSGGAGDISYFKNAFGLSEAEYNQLRGSIRVQNFMISLDGPPTWQDVIGNSDTHRRFTNEIKLICGEIDDTRLEELYNEYLSQMRGKADFAHQSITTAAILAHGLGYTEDNVAEWYLGADTSKMSGWLGDATITPIAFENDDYMSDLDAANIGHLMEEKGLGYMDAHKQYYDALTGGANRGALFLEHTPIEEVEMDIIRRMNREIKHGLSDGDLQNLANDAVARRHFIDENYLGNDCNDIYRFMQSLWGNPETGLPYTEMVK